jgi:hypothetical protein
MEGHDYGCVARCLGFVAMAENMGQSTGGINNCSAASPDFGWSDSAVMIFWAARIAPVSKMDVGCNPVRRVKKTVSSNLAARQLAGPAPARPRGRKPLYH